jgi:hypothetical protein
MLLAIRNLLIKAAWAPIAVLILHAVVARTSLRNPFDFPIHFLGGASIAFLSFHALECFQRWLGPMTLLARYLFSFCVACTVGVFWEIAERFLDVWFNMAIQQTLANTMSDLIADASGAVVSLLLVWVATKLRSGHASARS